MFLNIKLRILLALFIDVCMCVLNVMLLSNITPRSFSSFTCAISISRSPKSLSGKLILFWSPFPMCICLHFWLLSVISQSFVHLTTSSMSFWIGVSLLFVAYSLESSAKSCMVFCISLGMSLTYSKNRTGPRTLPWGTPLATGSWSSSPLIVSRDSFSHPFAFRRAEHSLPYSDVTIYIFAILYLSSMLYV